MDPLLGTITLFAGNFAPRGYEFCNGQLLAISSNTALFSILGTTYGGNGTTNFALPNLQGRVPIGGGTGPGLTFRQLGETGGTERVTLLTTEIPAHTHLVSSDLNVNNQDATNTTPVAGNSLALAKDINTDPAKIYNNTAPNTKLSSGSVASTAQVVGGSQPHSNMQPFIAINYIIATQGVFPSRN